MERHKKPFNCYFCHQRIENDTEMGHTSVCGNVLVPCPNKCGSYVPRMEMENHKIDCLNRPGRSMTRHTTKTDCVETFDESGRLISLTAKESIDRLHNEFLKLSNRLNNYELTISAGSNSHKDFDRVKYQNQMLIEWKKAVDFKLETLQQTLMNLEKNKNDSEYRLMNLDKKLSILDKLQMDLDLAMDSFLKEQNYNRQANLEFAKNFDDFKDLFESENTTTNTMWNELKLTIDEIRQDVDYLKQNFEEQKTKTISVVFDIKTISQIASETAENLEIQDREFANIRKSFDQLRLDMEILENLVAADGKISGPGHLIWKVDKFEEKMTKAKESNTVCKSPVFYTHDFGYKVRILAYLNGLKKWKDRYALISIHVLKGDFDALLKWPCHIQGKIILRDQENIENSKNFSKCIVAKRQKGDEESEEPQESSFTYIFIPHSTLIKNQYLKNDEIFIEIKIDQNWKLTTETTL